MNGGSPDENSLQTSELEAQQPGSRTIGFTAGELWMVRRFVRWRAYDAGLEGSGLADAVLAVNELAANSIAHGGGSGTVSAWREDGAIVFEVVDYGRFARPPPRGRRPSPKQASGRGLWLADQLCDAVHIRSGEGRTAVRATMATPA